RLSRGPLALGGVLGFSDSRALGGHDAIVDPQQGRSSESYGRSGPPETLGLVLNFCILVHQRTAEQPANNGADADRQECEAHVGPLLIGGSETRNVIVVARRLNDLADRQNEQRNHRADFALPRRENQPGQRSDHRPDNYGSKSRNLSRKKTHSERE